MELTQLPSGLPEPVDDGACRHLERMAFPALTLPSTAGVGIELSRIQGYTVVYCYPRTGRPGVAPPQGWDAIPGARGCTPQSCAFRDHHNELQALGASVYGLSSQSTAYQLEAKTRLHLPFELLSDEHLQLKRQLQLPTFMFEGVELYKRVTLILEGGVIVKAFYPVLPPDRNAADVVAWLWLQNQSES